MHIVKLHATTSTNDELRARFRESVLPHLTALYSLSQSQGRGNRGTTWQSEDGKNLTFSVLISQNLTGISVFQLNQIVSVALVEWLKKDLQVQAKIKWPNDILSVHKKLAGILIENTFKDQLWLHSIIGIGLNVNQVEFENVPHAISLKNLTGKYYALDKLLVSFLNVLNACLLDSQTTIEKYEGYLYKRNQEMLFKIDNQEVKAIVKGVNKNGKLILQHENQLTAYDIKELSWLY